MQEESFPAQPINRRAILCLTLAVFALFSFCIGAAPLPLTALVCYPASLLLGMASLWSGATAIQQLHQKNEKGRSLALIGIWIGGLTILFILCAMVLVTLLWPHVIEFIQEAWNQIPK